MEFQWPEAVAIESTRDDVVAGYAPRYENDWETPGFVTWQEAGHERRFDIQEVLEDTASVFRFKDAEGETHTLRAMTLELYEAQVKDRTVGKPTFKTMPELLEAMRQEW